MGPFPFELKFNPVVPVYGTGSPGELGNAAGGQAAGEEKAKGSEARKEEGQSAAAEAPTAVAPVDSESEEDSWVPADPVSLGGGAAKPAGAAVCPRAERGAR